MDIVKSKAEATRSLGDNAPLIYIGDWYWVKCQDHNDKEYELFACVVHIGTNFIQFEGPFGHDERVHFDDFYKNCRKEKDPEGVIRSHTERCQKESQAKLAEIKKITARLGLDPREADNASKALAVLSSESDPKAYKKALIKAKDKELPKLFEDLQKVHEEMTCWMKAQAIPMEAMGDAMKGAIDKIDDRVFSISLYAGLSEDVKEILGGEPAPVSEKLRLFQNLLFMDEECLLNYKTGGMEFGSISDFDAWLAKPENMKRILPFPRCAVGFQVRRNRKERDSFGCLATAFVNIKLEEMDKFTFFYIRNGEKLSRMGCDQEFNTTLFPGRLEFDLSEPMMAKISFSKATIISKREYDQKVKDWKDGHAKYLAYEEEHKAEKGKPGFHNPHWYHSDEWRSDTRDYEPFDKSSVYYDEMEKTIADRVKYYNRIALILQGLFDRSEILHPHPPVKLWDAEGFADAVELVYDATDVISQGEPPDFKAYVDKCNESLGADSLVIGQELFWLEREHEKERRRLGRRGHDAGNYSLHYKPYGDPGPGFFAKIGSWSPRARTATFKWKRERKTYSYYNEEPVGASISVPADRLFNVSAYKPGDWKKFSQDPRTRRHYLDWAPVLLAAEEYHAGNLKLGEDFSIKKEKKDKKKESK